MTWIRMDTAMKRDPRIWAMADALKREPAAIVGYVLNVLAEFPEHASAGDLTAIPDALVEQWAMWPGERGAFAAQFFAHLCEGRVVRAWEKHNGAAMRAMEASRARMRAHRTGRSLNSTPNAHANGAGTASANGTPNGTGDCTPVTGQDRTGQDKRTTTAVSRDRERPSQSTAGDAEPAEFRVAWAAYPDRAGGNPRRRALKAFRARLASGVRPADLVAGVERYAAFCAATGKVGTEFVMQGATFFGPDEPYAEPWTVTAPATGAAAVVPDRIVQQLAAEHARQRDDDAWLTQRLRERGGA